MDKKVVQKPKAWGGSWFNTYPGRRLDGHQNDPHKTFHWRVQPWFVYFHANADIPRKLKLESNYENLTRVTHPKEFILMMGTVATCNILVPAWPKVASVFPQPATTALRPTRRMGYTGRQIGSICSLEWNAVIQWSSKSGWRCRNSRKASGFS